MSAKSSYHFEARRIYVEAHGEGPWLCGMCNEVINVISRTDGTVHHIDENQTNNEITNLMILHKKCHNKHHNIGRTRVISDETRAKISASKMGQPSPRKGVVLSSQTRDQISAKLKGRKLSAETRAKMSAARQRDRDLISQRTKLAWAEGRGRNQYVAENFGQEQQNLDKNLI